MITADQIIIHCVGDYIIQSDYMAQEKTKKFFPCAIHVLTYIPLFFLLNPSFSAMLFIAVSHFVIDRWRLARYICYLKNYLGPKRCRSPWIDCSTTGYPKTRPDWLAFWLMIICDNLLHIICNGVALKYF